MLEIAFWPKDLLMPAARRKRLDDDLAIPMKARDQHDGPTSFTANDFPYPKPHNAWTSIC
jgi:hypothetical protein